MRSNFATVIKPNTPDAALLEQVNWERVPQHVERDLQPRRNFLLRRQLRTAGQKRPQLAENLRAGRSTGGKLPFQFL